jgi:hypothetical protein
MAKIIKAFKIFNFIIIQFTDKTNSINKIIKGKALDKINNK